MALCPFAVHRLIPPGSSDPAIKPRVAVLHVDAGGASTLFPYFRDRSGGIESHFFIRWDGVIEQYRDTHFQADANLDANDFAVSIETQGFGNGRWTKAQLASIKRLLLWLKEAHGIPLVRCSGPYGAGVGYHVMYGAPGPWTPVAKSCPGPNRIIQFEHILVPWMESVTTPPKPKRTRLEVITANLWRENPDVAADLAELAKMKPHIIGINEGRNFRTELATIPNYQIIRDTELHQNPILLRSDLKVLNYGTVIISEAVGRSPRRSMVWVRYRYAGQTRVHINTHFNSHVQAGATRPYNLPRVGEFIKGIRKVRRLVESFMLDGLPVTVSGDMNWSYTVGRRQWRYSPKRQFKKVGMVAQFADPSDPARLPGDPRRIEYVFYHPADLTLAGQRFVKRENSDHPYHSVSFFLKGI